MANEPWDSSNAMAGMLNSGDFDIQESVREQARTVRTASNRYEATKMLGEIKSMVRIPASPA